MAVQGGYFFMHKTIIVTNKVKQIMYSTHPPFHKGSLATAASGGKREHSAVWNNEYKEVHLCTTRYDYISDWTAAAVSLQSDYIKYIVYVQVLIVYYIASVNLQYYSNKGNPTLP